ncbi:hypothetical protein LCGC14_1519370, partial [marine sediment metagenome]
YIDYATGRVKAISGGGIVAGETSTFAYSKSQIGIDLSSLAGLIRVQRVEYPVGDIPQNFVQFDTFGRWVVITGGGESEGQILLAEDRQFRVYYDTRHQPPGEYAPGTVPGFLEDTVLMAAGAYALYMYALKQEHQVITDLASARTALSNATTSNTALATALTNMKKYLDDNSTAEAATSLASANTDHSAFATALTNMVKYLDNNGTDDATSSLSSANGDHSVFATALTSLKKYLDNNAEVDAAGILKDITDDATELRTAIATAHTAAKAELDAGDFTAVATHLTEADAALDKVATYLENNTNEDAKSWLTKITTDIAGLRTAFLTAVDALNTYLDSVATDLTSADSARANYMGGTANYVDGGSEPDIKTYLASGDALLNKVTEGGEGADVPRAYREYAQGTKESLVAAHEQDREFYQQDATARTNAAMGYANEAVQRLSNLRTYIEQAEGWGAIAAGFANEAEKRVQNTQAYVAEAVERNGTARGRAEESAARIAQMDRYLGEAAAYQNSAGQHAQLADSFRIEAIERRNEAWAIWTDPKKFIGNTSAVAVRQSASQGTNYNYNR